MPASFWKRSARECPCIAAGFEIKKNTIQEPNCGKFLALTVPPVTVPTQFLNHLWVVFCFNVA
jgi:hypothetical protein